MTMVKIIANTPIIRIPLRCTCKVRLVFAANGGGVDSDMKPKSARGLDLVDSLSVTKNASNLRAADRALALRETAAIHDNNETDELPLILTAHAVTIAVVNLVNSIQLLVHTPIIGTPLKADF